MYVCLHLALPTSMALFKEADQQISLNTGQVLRVSLLLTSLPWQDPGCVRPPVRATSLVPPPLGMGKRGRARLELTS
jgi:hypothetical protein